MQNEQRFETLKALGWKQHEECTQMWASPSLPEVYCYFEWQLPNHHEDANAQFEAWRGLSAGEQMMFLDFLGMVSRREGCFWLDAFNRHFCEIFLKTKNLWK